MSQIQSLDMTEAGYVVRDLIAQIRAHRDYLSEIDAAIGDGDHGINMSKGFSQCAERLDREGDADLARSLDALAQSLLEGIGGSMGPLYGSFFMSMADVFRQQPRLDAASFGRALHEGLEAVQGLGEAKVGDKTLIDTLVPAVEAYDAALVDGKSFGQSLDAMRAAAERGRDSTRDLQARIGRAARLGERSIGVLDAGATSCCLILSTMAGSIERKLH